MSFLNGSDKLEILRNGQKLFYERKYKLANQEFERYLDIYGYDEEVMKMKVICYLLLKEYKNAKNYCDRILRRDHLNEFALINKGHAFNELEKYDYALKALEIATYYYPYNPDAWCNKGRTLALLGRYDDSIECYKKSLELDPYHNEARIGLQIVNEKINE